MMSCILVLYIAISCTPGATRLAVSLLPVKGTDPADVGISAAATQAAEDPDALYARRDDLPSARRAAAIWAERLARNSTDFESAWKLARARYWLGERTAEAERKPILEEGIEAGRAAAAAQPERPEGYFWIAANMGALAESHGLRQGLKYRGAIKENLLTVLKIDPAFQQGSADRALGRWYYKVPGLFGGSKKKSEEHLRKSLTYNPVSTATLYFLAETLIELDRDREARDTLQKIVDAPLDPDWTPEDREFKHKAAEMLKRMK